jgi:hypothetical protein
MKPTLAYFDPQDDRSREASHDTHISFTTQTPSVVYQGEILSFYEDHFHHMYTEDPLNSCLASRLLSGK